MTAVTSNLWPRELALHALVVAVAVAIAVTSARPYAGSWNDGSRLAAVESLVDRHTWSIDDSIFVRPTRDAPGPYGEDALLRARGTQDKLLINGHFYSDKSPLPALLLAGEYWLWQRVTGLTAAQQPDRFCYWMTLGSSGLAYVVAVWCVFALGGRVGLSRGLRLLLTASFGLSTVALPYARQVNNHILLLAVATAVVLAIAGRTEQPERSTPRGRRLLGLGLLTGMGYGIDLGVGPVLLACTAMWVVDRCRRVGPCAAFILGVLPLVAVHHGITYFIAGTVQPAKTVLEYLTWPGSPFTAENMTGQWHLTPVHLLVYGGDLLVGKRGFLGHNLPLLLAVASVPRLLRRPRLVAAPEVLWAATWAGGSWLLYSLASDNYSGVCASIRWFVPLLAPGYLVLALLLRQYPQRWIEMAMLSGWGVVMAALMWRAGPWMASMVPLYWVILAAALLSWFAGVRRPSAVTRLRGGRQHRCVQPSDRL